MMQSHALPPRPPIKGEMCSPTTPVVGQSPSRWDTPQLRTNFDASSESVERPAKRLKSESPVHDAALPNRESRHATVADYMAILQPPQESLVPETRQEAPISTELPLPAANMSELEDRFEILDKSHADMYTRFMDERKKNDDLQTALDEKTKKIADLTCENAMLAKDRANIHERYNHEVQGHANRIKQKNALLQENANIRQDHAEELSKRIELESKLKEVEAESAQRLKELETESAQNIQTLATEIAALKEQIKHLERERLDSLEIKQQMRTLEAQLRERAQDKQTISVLRKENEFLKEDKENLEQRVRKLMPNAGWHG